MTRTQALTRALTTATLAATLALTVNTGLALADRPDDKPAKEQGNGSEPDNNGNGPERDEYQPDKPSNPLTPNADWDNGSGNDDDCNDDNEGKGQPHCKGVQNTPPDAPGAPLTDDSAPSGTSDQTSNNASLSDDRGEATSLTCEPGQCTPCEQIIIALLKEIIGLLHTIIANQEKGL